LFETYPDKWCRPWSNNHNTPSGLGLETYHPVGVSIISPRWG
jgi:hypothetical protein